MIVVPPCIKFRNQIFLLSNFQKKFKSKKIGFNVLPPKTASFDAY